MKIERRSIGKWPVVLAVFVAVFLFAFLTAKFKGSKNVEAANLANFDPGYIISDYQMSNYNSMSEAEIQNFLREKGNCGDTRTYLASYYPNLSYHIRDGHFVCLADETFGDGVAYGDGVANGASAAHIIWQAAQDYRINPQVLIVLLQKEQGLITDSWPNHLQYRSAAGYGCPDTAACDSKYYGFKNQVRNAAALFRTVLDGGWTNYPLGNNYIQYNPNSGCGGSVVNIRSLATSALYRYTPYQPNASALAAGYGSGDSCGAYGNRNFYLYFEDWFGGVTSDGWPNLQTIINTYKVPDELSDVRMYSRANVQHYGWLDWVGEGVMAGIAGYSIRTEAVAFKLDEEEDGGIEYRTHIEKNGWMDWAKNGEMSGLPGSGLRVEAVEIKLTGELSRRYDVYYRAHVEKLGWMDWVKNGEVAGTTGQSLRMEAIQVKIVKKQQTEGLEYSAHVQVFGWMDTVKGSMTAGTTGQSLRMEAIRMRLLDGLPGNGDLLYQTHVEKLGWMDWVKNGEVAGTTGQSLRMEAIKIKLTGELAEQYDVYYRAHVEKLGWMDWVKNGEVAGTTGQSLRMEALEIELVKK